MQYMMALRFLLFILVNVDYCRLSLVGLVCRSVGFPLSRSVSAGRMGGIDNSDGLDGLVLDSLVWRVWMVVWMSSWVDAGVATGW